MCTMCMMSRLYKVSWGVHVEPMLEEDEQPIIDEEAVFTTTCHQEVLELDRIDLQDVCRLEERGVFSQMRENPFEMMVHSSFGQPTDEVSVDALVAGRATVLSGSSPLQEYIDKACSITCPLLPIIERGADFLRQIFFE